MSESIICDIYQVDSSSQSKKKPAVMQIIRASNPKFFEIYAVSGGHQRIVVYEGDKLKCMQGNFYVHVRPGTPAGGFFLKTGISDGVRYNEITITKDLTRPIQRGKIGVKSDIGNIMRGTKSVR